ncbi:FtsX-like permease family protein [Falsibacillus albus]|uniref:ABC transporter permease n=1 Tax=Falsibacillus albus TaxID=2478915 RepID=A0A3L7K0R9_9BACI|nr:FtsX-like permease family protein [Falsibacillus albus]RLQ96646.1 ABC transporter permease [Falsibacillus albus]
MPIYLRLAIRSFLKQKAKAGLMIFSLIFCLSSIGILLNTSSGFEHQMQYSEKASNAADATIYTAKFNKDISSLNKIEGISAAESKSVLRSRAKINGIFHNIELTVLPDDTQTTINKINLVQGTGIRKDGMWFDSASGKTYRLAKSDKVTITFPGSKNTTLSVDGFIDDASKIPTSFSGLGYGYIKKSTLSNIGQPFFYNQVQLAYDHGLSAKQKKTALNKAKEELKAKDISIYRTENGSPTFFIRKTMVHSILSLLIILGILAFLLGFILITHLFHRLVKENIYSLSIQKVIGAKGTHIWKQYGFMIFIIGLILTLCSLPISYYASNYAISYLATKLNLNPISTAYYYSEYLLAMMVGLCFTIPFIASALPILKAAKKPIIHGLNGISSLSESSKKKKKKALFFHYSLLSFRNAFSKKTQVITNIVMLSFGGAIIVACMALNQSLGTIMNDMNKVWKYDIEWDVKSSLNKDDLLSLTKKIDGVKNVEGWTTRNTEVVSASGENNNALLYALPHDTVFIKPKLLKGEWLNRKNTDSIVVNSDFAATAGNLQPGESVTLKIGNNQKKVKVRGIISSDLKGPAVYMDEGAYSEWLSAQSFNRLLVGVKDHSSPSKVLTDGETFLQKNDIYIEGSDTVKEMNSRPREIIALIVRTLTISGAIFGIVGVFNLMTAMSVSVYERIQEIGIIRSLGGTNRKIVQLFMGESIIISLISWMLAAAMSYPLDMILGWKIGEALIHTRIPPILSTRGCIVWLLISLFIGVCSSILPVMKAAKHNLRDIL